MEKEYIWMVSADAAKGFPATFHYGYLGDTEIRGKGVLGYGWGLGGTLTGSISEKRPLPKQLDLVWMSYAENQFYEGHFELDHKKIAAVFEKGYKSNTDKGVIMDHNFSFRINVAPGGTVAIWLMGQYGFQREVGFYQAKKTTVVWKDFLPNGMQDSVLYVSSRLKNHVTKKQLEKYQSEGIPYKKWENYRQEFEWKVTIKGSPRVIILNTETFNGEQYTLKDDFLNIDKSVIKAALPIEFGMQWEEDPIKEEMFTASLKIKENDFKKLTMLFKENDSKGHFVIAPYIDKNVKKVKLFLVTGTEKQALELEENTVRHFSDYYKK